MPVPNQNLDQIAGADFSAGFDKWFHEGIGRIAPAPEGGMRLHCLGSRQGQEGCHAFFRQTLPDQIAVEYDLCIRSQGGLLINFLALRGLNGEDLIEDRDRLPKRTGRFGDYVSPNAPLQSYHVSISRFGDKGEHTFTSNWRRNPGLILVGHGNDPITEVDRWFRVRITKDAGHCQLYVDGQFAHAFIDRDTSRHPIPDTGKFGFRLIGNDVMADVRNFAVYRVAMLDEKRR